MSTNFQTYIPEKTALPEFSLRAVVLGSVLGIVFGASSLYLVLKVGLTVSASIPVAVISITLFRLWAKMGFRDASILENNIVQTAGSAGESLAFGLGVTMPAILILGFDLELTRVFLVAALGGVLGILMMIPLRRALIVEQHGVLKYPEGSACAEVLKAGADAASRAEAKVTAFAGAGISAVTIFAGFAIGLVYKVSNIAFKGWKDVPEKVFGAPMKSGSVAVEVSPELLGVGYIIGPRIASIMCAGGVLTYLLLIPLIKFFGDGLTTPVAPGAVLISAMEPGQIRGAYVLYIGAGAVAAGGVISLFRALPMIWRGLKQGLQDYRVKGDAASTLRTQNDIPLKWVGIGVIVLMAAITLAPSLHMNLIGAFLIVLFGFLFVTVSSRLTGEIGSSSNPISGMTVATLLLTCLIFLLLGWTGGTYYVTALSVGAIVCIAASNGGTTSQDLKTGYLVGATPRLQQYAIMIGSLASAVMLGPILLGLNQAATVYVPIEKIAPGLRTELQPLATRAALEGPQAATDNKTYRIWHKSGNVGGPEGQYLVDDNGAAVYFVDPGINGIHAERPDGTKVRKYDAPKATLMSYIIKGILDSKLPWELVLFGVMISLVLEMAGIPSLAFAVGVYLPLSSSTPIFIGGLVRWLIDRKEGKKAECKHMSAVELCAQTDKGPGVLMASGFIAGGAIAGIFIALSAGVFVALDTWFNDWSTKSNPFFQGPYSDALSMLPFGVLVLLLYLAARGRVFSGGVKAG
ncbi:MAG: oligopeptide transporter, OPT family [Betaproteobacteria bacterium]